MPNISGVVSTIASSGSSPVRRQTSKVNRAARTSSAPWATLMMRITPNTNVSPEASNA